MSVSICKYFQLSYSNTIVILEETMMSMFELETLMGRSRVFEREA